MSSNTEPYLCHIQIIIEVSVNKQTATCNKANQLLFFRDCSVVGSFCHILHFDLG